MKLQLDKNSKDMVEEISTLLGVKAEIVKTVWEFTLLTYLLKYSKSENKVKSLSIPYIGNIGIRYNGDSVENTKDSLSGDFDVFISLNDDFKKMLHSIEIGSTDEIINLLQNEIKKVANQID